MSMNLWFPGAGRDGLQVKVEGGKAYGRVGSAGDWDEIDNPADVFAPGGDPLAFLAAAENIREPSASGGQQPSGVGQPSTTPFSGPPSYTFDIDGREFAMSIRSQLEAEMRRNGELPAGVTLGVVRQYVDMEGSGELWLTEDGLPARQVLHLKFPPDKGAYDWAEADITTDFTNWDTASVYDNVFSFIARLIDDPLSLVGSLSSVLPPISEGAKQVAFVLVFTLLVVGVSLFAITRRVLPQVYVAVGAAVILSLNVEPLVQAHSVSAYVGRQETRRAEYEKQEEVRRRMPEVEAELSGRVFNPYADPLAGSAASSPGSSPKAS